MAQIAPFRAFRHNPSRTRWDQVLTQPYDKISPEMQDRYYSLSPYNLISIEKGRFFPDDSPSNNVYTRAAAKLSEWIRDGILIQDPEPSIYIYSQDYTIPGTANLLTRTGFLALGHLEDYSAGIVFRHEQTLSGPRADRLELLRRTRAQTGKLFMLYEDPARRTDSLLAAQLRVPAPVELRDEYDVLHRLWPVSDPAIIATVEAEMASKKLIIADGHHRYETALAFRDECRKRTGASDPNATYEWALMAFFNSHSEGLTILPTHRVIANLPGFQLSRFLAAVGPHFSARQIPFNGKHASRVSSILAALASARHQHVIGAFAGEPAFLLLTLRPDADIARLLPDVSPTQRQLDLILLHRLLLEHGLGITPDSVVKEKNITYAREAESAVAAVAEGRAQICFLVNPVRMDQVVSIALAGEVLPQKSTDFYPKLLSGLAIYCLEK